MMTSETFSAARPAARASQVGGTATRWPFLNLTLACVLVAVAQNPLVTLLVGLGAIGLGAYSGLRVAIRHSRAVWPTITPDTIAVWIVGLVALGAAAAGLWFYHNAGAQSWMRSAGLALFVAQISLILGLGSMPASAAARGHR